VHKLSKVIPDNHVMLYTTASIQLLLLLQQMSLDITHCQTD